MRSQHINKMRETSPEERGEAREDILVLERPAVLVSVSLVPSQENKPPLARRTSCGRDAVGGRTRGDGQG